MPISRDMFDEQIDDVDQEILDFLEASPEEAFSLNELAEVVSIFFETVPDWTAFIERLYDLVRGRLIVSRTIHGVQYFSIAEEEEEDALRPSSYSQILKPGDQSRVGKF